MRKIKAAVIGTDFAAERMAGTLAQMREFSCRAVVGGGRRKDPAEKFRIPKNYQTPEELFADGSVEMVCLAEPAPGREELIRSCLEAGLHVLAEKPLSLSSEETKSLFALAKEKNLVLAECVPNVYMPLARKIRELLKERVIGEPVNQTASLGFASAKNRRLNDRERGGGCLYNLCPYGLHLALMAFGEEILEAKALCSFTKDHVDEQTNVSFVYRNGRMANVTASLLGVMDNRLVITGTRGRITASSVEKLTRVEVLSSDGKRLAGYEQRGMKTGLEYCFREFAEAITEGNVQTESLPAERSIRAAELTERLASDLGLNREPAEETFVLPGLEQYLRANAVLTGNREAAKEEEAREPEEDRSLPEKEAEEKAVPAATLDLSLDWKLGEQK